VRGRAGRHRPDRHLQGDGQSPPVRAAPERQVYSRRPARLEHRQFRSAARSHEGRHAPARRRRSCREFLYYKHLVKQENPRTPIAVKYQLYINGAFANNQKVLVNGYWEIPFGDIDFNKIDNWLEIDKVLRQVPGQFPDKTVEIRKLLYLNNNLVTQYIVKNDNYFMMGDNRDNSTDSRYWGFLNRNFVKAKAFILYFSWDSSRPLWDPLKIRWNRIGRLIRSWTAPARSRAPGRPAAPRGLLSVNHASSTRQ